MPTLKKQVRVFISSTFRDMHAERDHLVTVVFPELRERVEQLGLEFFDVDLRWGVPEKGADGETANSWEYCRQWIDRVEPFFVCMLGQRYGWVPKPGELKDKEALALQEKDPRSITDMEVRYAALNDRRKRRSYFYLRKELVPEPGKDAPKKVRDMYADFVDQPNWLKKLDALKDEIKSCGRPVREYPCEWTDGKFTKFDEFGKMVLEDLWSGVLRDERYVSKDIWRQALGTEPDDDERFTNEWVPIAPELWKKIVELAKPAAKDPLLAERDQMAAFAAARLRWFQGRTAEIKQLKEFIASTDENAPRLAVIAAAPGQGKSALLARLWQDLAASTINHQPSPILLAHFIGATGGSANSYSLAKRLLDELEQKDSGIQWPKKKTPGGQPKEEPKLDFNSLCRRLAERMGDYAGERRIVILIDALNQLTDGHDLNWLPRRLGSSVRIVVSCVDDPVKWTAHSVARASPTAERPDHQEEPGAIHVTPEQRVLQVLASRQPAPLRVPLGPLTEADVRTIVEEYLREYCKELDDEYVDTICDEKKLPQARNPLYLLVMLAELRTLGGNDMNKVVPQLIASMAKEHPDTVSLFKWVLERMEKAEGFGKEPVKWWCLYLAHGRVGMASHELADLLARKLGAEAAAKALRIERGLRRYLQRRGGQLDFFHAQLRQAVIEHCGAGVPSMTVHRDLAEFFDAKDYFLESDADQRARAKRLPPTPRPINVRKVVELPWQCLQTAKVSGNWDAVEELFTDLFFLEAKAEGGMVFELAEDFSAAVNALPHERPRRRILCLLEEALRRDISFVARHPTTVFQCMWNTCAWYDCPECDAPRSACKADREGCILLNPQSKLYQLLRSWRRCKTEHAPGSILIIAKTSPFMPLGNPGCVFLKGHRVNSLQCVFSPDSRILVTGGIDLSGKEGQERDTHVRIWDLSTCRLRGAYSGHMNGVTSITMTPDGTKVASIEFRGDRAIHIWELATQSLIAKLLPHSINEVMWMVFDRKGVCLSGVSASAIDIWVFTAGIDAGNALHFGFKYCAELPPRTYFLNRVPDRGHRWVRLLPPGTLNVKVEWPSGSSEVAIPLGSLARYVLVEDIWGLCSGWSIRFPAENTSVDEFLGRSVGGCVVASILKARKRGKDVCRGRLSRWIVSFYARSLSALFCDAAPTTVNLSPACNSAPGKWITETLKEDDFQVPVVRDAENGSELARLQLKLRSEPVFSPDGTMVAALFDGTSVLVWHWRDQPHPQFGLQEHRCHTPSSGCLGNVVSEGMYEVSNGHEHLLVTTRQDGKEVCRTACSRQRYEWNTPAQIDGTPVRASPGIASFAMSRDGRYVVFAQYQHGIMLWDLNQDPPELCNYRWPAHKDLVLSNAVNGRVPESFGHEWLPTELAFSPDGKQIAGADFGRQVSMLWEVDTGALIFYQDGYVEPSVLTRAPAEIRYCARIWHGEAVIEDRMLGLPVGWLAETGRPQTRSSGRHEWRFAAANPSQSERGERVFGLSFLCKYDSKVCADSPYLKEAR